MRMSTKREGEPPKIESIFRNFHVLFMEQERKGRGGQRALEHELNYKSKTMFFHVNLNFWWKIFYEN